MAIWLAVGWNEAALFLSQRWPRRPLALGLGGLSLTCLAALFLLRFPALSLREDRAAQDFVTAAAAVLEPNSIVVSLADNETFALWYGAWASGELTRKAPGLVLINYSLYQFDWYRRLLRAQYPTVVDDQPSVEAILASQANQRPIYFSEQLSYVPEAQLQPVGPLWLYRP